MLEEFLHFLDSLAFPSVYAATVSLNVYFKTAQDGRKLVYPWGALGFVGGAAGYVITSEQQYKLLRRHLKANEFVWVVLVGIAASYIPVYLGPHHDFLDLLPFLIVVSCFIAFDMIWR
jgi:hypothetical protein